MVSKNRPVRLAAEVAETISRKAKELNKSTAEASRVLFGNAKKIFSVLIMAFFLLSWLQVSTASTILIGDGSFENGPTNSAENWVRWFANSGPSVVDFNFFPDQADQTAWVVNDINCSLGTYCGKLQGLVGGDSEYTGWVNKQRLEPDQNFLIDANFGGDTKVHIRFGTLNPTTALTCSGALAVAWQNCIGFVGSDNTLQKGIYRDEQLDSPEACAPDGCYVYVYGDSFFGKGVQNPLVDNFRLIKLDVLTNTIIEPDEPVLVNAPFDINITVNDGNSDISDALVRVSFNNGPFEEIDYNAEFAVYTFDNNGDISIPGDYNFAVWSTRAGDAEDYDEGLIEIRIDFRSFVIINELSNITSSIDLNVVNLTPKNNKDCIQWRTDTNFSETFEVYFRIWNSINDGRQYFIYTSSDGNNFVFNDTLTFGTNFDNPVQKIWDSEQDSFRYDFSDIFIAHENKFHQACFEKPMKWWETIGRSTEWVIQLEPQLSEFGGTIYDIYTVSGFSDIRNVLLEHIADLTTSTSALTNYEFQFTAFTESGTLTINTGTVHETGGAESSNGVTISSSAKRFSMEINSNSFDDQLFMESAATTSTIIYIRDYALIQRGYFSKRLEVTQADFSELPVILLNGQVDKYIREGEQFRVSSQAYDRVGDLNFLEIEVFLDSTDDQNRVKFFRFEIDPEEETFFNINQLIEAVVDLNGTAIDTRDIRIKTTLVDADSNKVATQSRWFKFLQYPYFPDDVKISFTQDGRKVGENPKGHVSLEVSARENLIGLKLVIFDENSSKGESDFNKIFYLDEDFSCNAFDCSFDYFLDEWKFEDQNIYTMTWYVWLNTENFNFDNILLQTTKAFIIQYRSYETFRMFETFERLDHTYRNDEEIPVILQIREVGDYGTWANIKNQVNVHVKISNCDADVNANCDPQTTRYPADAFLYDEKTGYNYFFFRQLFLMDDGSLLPDGNYIRFSGVVEDVETVRSADRDAFLTAKCLANDRDTDCSSGGIPGLGTCFFNNMLASLNHFALGCTTAPPLIVATGISEGLESRLLIDEDHALTEPTQECFACVNVDQNNTYQSSLKQDLLCAAWYKQGERPIDQFTFTITNKNSDLSDRDDETRQYLRVNVPYELIAFNDIQMMRKGLEAQQFTTPDTVGDMIALSFNNLLTNYLNYHFTAVDSKTIQNVLPNAGFDCNFNNPIDPSFIDGLLFFKVHGLEVTNMEDFRNVEDIEFVDESQFYKFAKANNIQVPDHETQITVYVSDFKKVIDIKTKSNFVIKESVKDQEINIENIDANNVPAFRNGVPTILKFNIISDLTFGNHGTVIRRYVPIRLMKVITLQFNIADVGEAVDEFIANPVDWVINFLFGAIVIITIILMMALVVSIMYRNFTGGGK